MLALDDDDTKARYLMCAMGCMEERTWPPSVCVDLMLLWLFLKGFDGA